MTEQQLAVSSLLDVLSRTAALKEHIERKAQPRGFGGCACLGPQSGEPVCGCAMWWVHRVGSNWYEVGYEPETGCNVNYLCKVGWRPVRKPRLVSADEAASIRRMIFG
jgi:hypothetical protein